MNADPRFALTIMIAGGGLILLVELVWLFARRGDDLLDRYYVPGLIGLLVGLALVFLGVGYSLAAPS